VFFVALGRCATAIINNLPAAPRGVLGVARINVRGNFLQKSLENNATLEHTLLNGVT